MTKKTLLVTYTPRHGSNTAKLVDIFTKLAKGKTTIEHLDVSKEVQKYFNEHSINAYVKKFYMGQKLDEKEEASLKYLHDAVKQFKSADYVVLAYPMHNFSFPAAVKAWFDSVIVAGETFKMTGAGTYEGLLKGKKALVLTTSGGDYSNEKYKHMDHSTTLAELEFGFMGFETKVVKVSGTSKYETVDAKIAEAGKEIESAIKSWY